jgi:hypothetical protein
MVRRSLRLDSTIKMTLPQGVEHWVTNDDLDLTLLMAGYSDPRGEGPVRPSPAQ